MTREEAHQLIDQLYDMKESIVADVTGDGIETRERALPIDKRVVRTKSSGDRVYLLDEVKKTRQWVTTGEILQACGFEMSDVNEVDDAELLKYQMASPIYKAPDA